MFFLRKAFVFWWAARNFLFVKPNKKGENKGEEWGGGVVKAALVSSMGGVCLRSCLPVVVRPKP